MRNEYVVIQNNEFIVKIYIVFLININMSQCNSKTIGLHLKKKPSV